jgi:hypothetical protein
MMDIDLVRIRPLAPVSAHSSKDRATGFYPVNASSSLAGLTSFYQEKLEFGRWHRPRTSLPGLPSFESRSNDHPGLRLRHSAPGFADLRWCWLIHRQPIQPSDEFHGRASSRMNELP